MLLQQCLEYQKISFANFVRLIMLGYLELNPVKARMVDSAWDYPWSRVHAHLSGNDEFDLVDTEKMLTLISDWKSYLLDAQSHSIENFEKHERTGRPLGSDRFIEKAEFFVPL